jgi:hypothetical protein
VVVKAHTTKDELDHCTSEDVCGRLLTSASKSFCDVPCFVATIMRVGDAVAVHEVDVEIGCGLDDPVGGLKKSKISPSALTIKYKNY